MTKWVERDVEAVRRRYDKLAPIYPVFDWLWLPRGLRREAVDWLELAPGNAVLEVGCGTGRNFPLLLDAVGPQGRLIGVDSSTEMLKRASALQRRRVWPNVTLDLADASNYRLPEPIDAALFSLSYATMPQRGRALEVAWSHLRPGGRLVIMDAKVPSGRLQPAIQPILVWLSRLTVLGNPDARPWDDLRRLAGTIQMRECLFGVYFICRGTKVAS